jgi:hypothetical protein
MEFEVLAIAWGTVTAEPLDVQILTVAGTDPQAFLKGDGVPSVHQVRLQNWDTKSGYFKDGAPGSVARKIVSLPISEPGQYFVYAAIPTCTKKWRNGAYAFTVREAATPEEKAIRALRSGFSERERKAFREAEAHFRVANDYDLQNDNKGGVIGLLSEVIAKQRRVKEARSVVEDFLKSHSDQRDRFKNWLKKDAVLTEPSPGFQE